MAPLAEISDMGSGSRWACIALQCFWDGALAAHRPSLQLRAGQVHLSYNHVDAGRGQCAQNGRGPHLAVSGGEVTCAFFPNMFGRNSLQEVSH